MAWVEFKVVVVLMTLSLEGGHITSGVWNRDTVVDSTLRQCLITINVTITGSIQQHVQKGVDCLYRMISYVFAASCGYTISSKTFLHQLTWLHMLCR